MLPYQRMKRLYPLKPHVRKGVPTSQTYKVPQYNGTPGWLLFSHDAEGQAVSLFVDNNDVVTPTCVVLDERLFSDSVFRAIRLAPAMFIACDIRYLNGKNLFETMCFEDRKKKLEQLLDLFHLPDFTAFLSVDDVPIGTPLRGHEYYDDKPGTVGVFLPAVE